MRNFHLCFSLSCFFFFFLAFGIKKVADVSAGDDLIEETSVPVPKWWVSFSSVLTITVASKPQAFQTSFFFSFFHNVFLKLSIKTFKLVERNCILLIISQSYRVSRVFVTIYYY